MDKALIRLHIEWQPEGVYLATSPDVPGLIVEAPTVALAIKRAGWAAKALRESYIAHGQEVPVALQRFSPSQGPLDISILVGVE